MIIVNSFVNELKSMNVTLDMFLSSSEFYISSLGISLFGKPVHEFVDEVINEWNEQ